MPQKGFIGFDIYPRRPYPYYAITMGMNLNVVKKDGLFYLYADCHGRQGKAVGRPLSKDWDMGDTVIVSQIYYCPYCGEKL